MSQNIITELHYLPCITYIKHVQNTDNVLLEACENYQKSSYRNRCHILGSDGLQRLSIPLLQGKNQKQAIRDVRIENSFAWQRQHLHALRSAYGSAPFWEHYAGYLEAHFQKKHQFLWDWNIETLALLFKLLKIKTPMSLTTAYEFGNSAVVDLRNTILPKHEIITASYPQVFSYKHDFLPNLSAIDVLMNVGSC